MKGTGVVKFGSGQVKCMIRGISNDEMIVVAKNSSVTPTILEAVKLDLSPSGEGGIVTDIGGYIYSLTAMEKKASAEFFSMNIRFNTEDKQTREQVTQFLLSIE